MYSRLLGTEKCGKSFTEGENKKEIKGQIRVALRPVSLVFFHCEEKEQVERMKRKRREQRRQASPTTNDSQDNSMTNLR